MLFYRLYKYFVRDTARYAEVALANNVQKGRWVMLENPNFLIPTGAADLMLYVEMPDDSTANFFIDDMMGGIAGAAERRQHSSTQ